MDACERVVRQFLDACSKGRRDEVESLMEEGFRFQWAPMEEVDREGFLDILERLRSAFPDLRLTASAVTTADGACHGQVGLEGTHEGELALPGLAPVAATRNLVRLHPEPAEWRVRDGKLQSVTIQPPRGGGVDSILFYVGSTQRVSAPMPGSLESPPGRGGKQGESIVKPAEASTRAPATPQNAPTYRKEGAAHEGRPLQDSPAQVQPEASSRGGAAASHRSGRGGSPQGGRDASGASGAPDRARSGPRAAEAGGEDASGTPGGTSEKTRDGDVPRPRAGRTPESAVDPFKMHKPQEETPYRDERKGRTPGAKTVPRVRNLGPDSSDPLDKVNKEPRGMANLGLDRLDSGEEMSGSSAGEEPHTKSDGTTTPGSYDGGRRRD